MSNPDPSLPPHGLLLRDLLRAAGAAALDVRARGTAVHRKADGTPVTDADLAAERVLLDGLRARWPDDDLDSEEGGGRAARGTDARWVVDPLDGTSAFVEGLAHWGPTVARVRGGVVELGALFLPQTGEHWHVENGRAWADGRPLGPLDGAAPAVVYLPSEFHRSATLDWSGKARCLGGTAAHLALVARGSAQAAVVAGGWKMWDAAAGLALIRAVSGEAFRLSDGVPLDLVRDVGVPFVAGVTTVARELCAHGRIRDHLPGAAHGT